jgi:aspartyl-tRNA(Asn)/glutamyl-tRNA(Gln) amidotransferase subunit A
MERRWTLAALGGDLRAGRTTARALVEASLARIADLAFEGATVFLKLHQEAARTAADAIDAERKAGRSVPPHAGIPISVKDLFDLAGDVTTAGSMVLKTNAPAVRDAPAIARLKAEGFIVLGRTNMTEFAYSGVGLNPHYGTPRSTFDRKTGRIPGGSSSGAAISVADGMAAFGIGSDTGGSCRIPAAYNGLVGFKPSAGRVSTEGVFPLSSSFDSVGPIANTVACCAVADATMAGDWDGRIAGVPASSLRFGVLKTTVLDHLDHEVAADFERALSRLSKAGVQLVEFDLPELLELPELTRKGGIVAFEAHVLHKDRLAERGAEYDPRVSMRLEAAAALSRAEYDTMCARRKVLIAAFNEKAADFSGVVMPSVMNIPPPIAALAQDDDYLRYNGLSLRNTYIGNFLNGCAINLPMNEPMEAPTGFMILNRWGRDTVLFSSAQAVEAILAVNN